MPFGIGEDDWETAKEEAKRLLARRARRRRRISSQTFVRRIGTLPFEFRDPRLDALLSEVSTEEHAAGRGMLTVLVVHADGDRLPGPGFFELARRLGYEFDDEEIFWGEEFERVCAAWEAVT